MQELHNVVARLESRIKDLEARYAGVPTQPKTLEEIRMILIGPPGAGTAFPNPA